MSLREYIRKRDFEKTAEPRATMGRGKRRRFVIQKHAASHLHYDFRLEINGVLKSWAVPKGMPYAKGEKRLAVQVEDHPVSYINFEGTIPAGNYGGGTVMVWDQGEFTTEVKSPAAELAGGKLHFNLDGKKLRGAWYLVQLRGSTQWLMIKGGEDMKPVSAKQDDISALSGKSLAQLGKNGAIWESKPREKERARKAARPEKTGLKCRPRQFIEPMKARLMESPPAGADFIYEIKFDGFRALAFKDKHGVQLLSRNDKDFNGKFPEIAEAVAGLGTEEFILDGEIVALDEHGISSFQLLQAFELGRERPPLFFYVFDLLSLNGEDLRTQPLLERKVRLEKLLGKKSGRIRYSASLGEDAKRLLKRVKKIGLEGLIGKRKDSPYEAGRRTGAWFKLKLHREQEFVIGGFTDPEGSRQHFGALLVGIHVGKKLKFCGKVGTGFDGKLLKALDAQFRSISHADCPFVNLPETSASRYHAGITAGRMKSCHWVRPELVCQVKFSEWTLDARLRQPVFLGLREDKDAAEVVREKAA